MVSPRLKGLKKYCRIKRTAIGTIWASVRIHYSGTLKQYIQDKTDWKTVGQMFDPPIRPFYEITLLQIQAGTPLLRHPCVEMKAEDASHFLFSDDSACFRKRWKADLTLKSC